MKKRNASRALAVLMSLCLALGGFGLTASAAKKYKAEATSKVNIRKGPSSRAEKAGEMKSGEECILVAVVKKGRTVGDYTADMDFYKISDGNYVAAKYIKWTEEINDDSEDDSSEDSSEDSSSDEDVSDVDDGDDVSGDEDGVEIEDGLMEVGGSSSSSDDSDSEETEEVSDEESEPEEKTAKVVTGTVNTSALNVRTKPSSGSTVIKKLKKGEKVTLSEAIKDGSSYSGSKVSGNWYKLKTGGFVAANYLNVSASESTASGGDSSAPAVTVATGAATANATLYQTASTSSTQKGTMKKGESKVIKSSHADGTEVGGKTISGNWYRLDNGYYVQAKYIKVSKNSSGGSSGGATASSSGVSKGATVRAIKNVNIRKGASTSTSKMGLFTAGKTDTVAEVSGSWIKLKSTGGYVSTDYVTVVSEGTGSTDNSSSSSEEDDIPVDDDIPVE